MNVINNVCGPGTKEISDTIEQSLKSRDDSSFKTFPMIFAIKYVKDSKSGILIPHYMYGLLRSPVVLYNSVDEGDNMIYVSLAQRNHLYKIGDEEIKKERGDLAIPKHLKVVDVERSIHDSDSRAIVNAEVSREPNVINLYFGDAAFLYFNNQRHQGVNNRAHKD
jgi:hypothetical protein